MQHFSIKQIEQLSGIKAPTLRIWEKRYRLFAPCRTIGRQRVYSNEDLQAILQVVFLYKNGIKISGIAKLKQQQKLQETLGQLINAGSKLQSTIPVLIEAAIDLNAGKLESVFAEIEQQYGFEMLMLEVIYPFMEQLGRAWVAGKVRPNNEHFVSSIVSRKLLFAIAALPRVRHGNRVVLFQPEQEFHEIPLLFMQYLFKKNGWRTVYFGSNTATATIMEYCKHHQVSHLYLHMLTAMPENGPQGVLSSLSKVFPDKMIVAGGAVFKNTKAAGENILLLKKPGDILEFINRQVKTS